MITGVHAVLHTRDAAADRPFFGEILGFRAIDAGDGWLGLYEPRHPTVGHGGRA